MTRDRRTSIEIPVQFIEIEPLYKHIFRKPLRRFRTFKNSILEQHQYGPPYAPPNPLLETAFLDDVRRKNVNLLSVHECLSAHRIDPNLSHPDDNRNRPLHYAAKYGNLRLVKMLLRAKADVRKLNGLGQSPLMVACGGKTARHAEIVTILIEEERGDTTTTTTTTTTAAVEDIDMVDRGGNTALTNAIRASNARSVAVLLAAGAAVTVAAGSKRDDVDGDCGASTTTTTTTTTKDRSVVAAPGTVAALPLAQNIRAETAGIDVVGSDEYFDTLKEFPPSWRDRIMKQNACAPSSVIVDMLHDAIEGGRRHGEEGGDNVRDGQEGCWSCCCRLFLLRKR